MATKRTQSDAKRQAQSGTPLELSGSPASGPSREPVDALLSAARGEPVARTTVAGAGDATAPQTPLAHPDASASGSLADLTADGLNATIDSIPIALLVFDRAGRVRVRNEAARVLLPDDADVRVILSKLATTTQYDDWTLELKRVLESRTPRRFDALVRPARDQAEVFLSLVCSPLRDSVRGDVIGGVLLAEDVSARVNMEQRLAVSERLAALGKLAARVAHELNNPLDGILRYVNLALRVGGQSGADPRVAEYLDKARSGLMRMTQITTSLLEFSRQTHAPLEQATINKIVEDAITAMNSRAADHGVTVVCNFHQDDMPVVRGSNIFQVFCNLIKNAIDAMPGGGTLTVTTKVDGPDVVVAFEDTGVGLPADAERIFEPFFTTKDPGKGTGLGLAVCKEIIERYSGTISAHRRQPKGTAFVVRIPARNCATAPQAHGLPSGGLGSAAS